MTSTTKAEMGGDVGAMQDKRVGVIKHRRVAIGSGIGQGHWLTRPNESTVQLDRLGNRAGETTIGRVKSY